MKFYKRLLSTIPFVIVAFGYYKFDNPDQKCNVPIYAVIFLFIFGLLLLTGIRAIIAVFTKRPSNKPTPEPITFSILLITSVFIIYSIIFRGHTNGDEWIVAEHENLSDWQESKGLTLRKNGNFTFSPNTDCAFSGKFKKIGDTIILDKNIIDTNEISAVYLLESNKLVPLFDRINKITFTVTEIK